MGPDVPRRTVRVGGARLAADTAAPLEPGTELAPGYRVLAHLNRGNRLDVYDAWSDERASRCVLKTLRPDRAHEPRARRALEQEGRLLRRFSHPHLVRAYELTAALDDGRPVMVLETLSGETLSHLIHRLDDAGRRLTLLDAAMLGVQLASALHYLHGQGWLHLDLKPANIVAEAGRARVIDLSIARRPGRGRPGTGTFEYLSPEQARGGQLTAAADVWGLGAVLYAALTAQPPFGYEDDEGEDDEDDDDAPATPEASVTGETEPLEEVYPQLSEEVDPVRRHRRMPSDLAAVVDACLRKEPAERPTVAELSAGLEAWIASRARPVTAP